MSAEQGLIPGVPAVSFAAWSESFHGPARRARVPIHAMVELTYGCNFDCVHCYVVQPHTRGELGTAEVRALFEQLRDAGVLFLCLTGGEPLSRPDFEELYLHAKRLGFLVTLFTNAALLRERALALFERYPPHRVEVTLYGASEETYRAVTRRRNVRDLVLAGVDRLLGMGVEVGLKTVGIAGNAPELEAIRAQARRRGLDGQFRWDGEIQVKVDCTRGPAAARLRPADVVAADAREPGRVAEFRRLYLRTVGRRYLDDGRLFRCGAGRSSLVVDPYGKLHTCTLYRREGFDLRRGSLTAGWEHLHRVASQAVTRPTRCRSCDKFTLCGACAGNNALESGGDPEAPPDFLCELTYARVAAFCADLRPALPPLGRALPLLRRRECPRPWLVPEPLGEVRFPRPGRRGAGGGVPGGGRLLPVVR